MKYIRKLTILLIAIFVLSSNVEAKYVQTAKAKYKKEYGWSQYYTVEITFISGYELNKATRTYDYSAYSIYAVIFWDRDQASVIKFSTFTGCGTEVNKSCIVNTVTNLEGKDQRDVKWEICVKDYCL